MSPGPITYAIELSHNDKGVAFVAKEAFLNYVRQPHSGILSVRLENQTTQGSRIILTVEPDQHFPSMLEQYLEKSGRMPNDRRLWDIKSVIRISNDKTTEEDAGVNRRLEQLTRDLREAIGRESGVREENARLSRRLDELATKTANTPLEGLLSYFGSLNYSLSIAVNEEVDLGFAQRVLTGEVENTFLNYFNYVNLADLTEVQLKEIAKFNYNAEANELRELEPKVSAAKKELDYLEGILQEKIFVPETLKADIINTIKSKDNEKVIQKYTELESTLDKKSELKLRVEKETVRYDSFSDQIDVLSGASSPIPAILYCRTDNKMEMYLPFVANKVQSGILSSLLVDMKKYFISREVTPSKQSKYITYIIEKSDVYEDAKRIEKDVPLTLRLAAYDRVVPHIIFEK